MRSVCPCKRWGSVVAGTQRQQVQAESAALTMLLEMHELRLRYSLKLALATATGSLVHLGAAICGEGPQRDRLPASWVARCVTGLAPGYGIGTHSLLSIINWSTSLG